MNYGNTKGSQHAGPIQLKVGYWLKSPELKGMRCHQASSGRSLSPSTKVRLRSCDEKTLNVFCDSPQYSKLSGAHCLCSIRQRLASPELAPRDRAVRGDVQRGQGQRLRPVDRRDWGGRVRGEEWDEGGPIGARSRFVDRTTTRPVWDDTHISIVDEVV